YLLGIIYRTLVDVLCTVIIPDIVFGLLAIVRKCHTAILAAFFFNQWFSDHYVHIQIVKILIITAIRQLIMIICLIPGLQWITCSGDTCLFTSSFPLSMVYSMNFTLGHLAVESKALPHTLLSSFPGILAIYIDRIFA
ncbi:hypothetical protein ACJX0J_006409, partial [Zea mays]